MSDVEGWAVEITYAVSDLDVAVLRETVDAYNIERTGYDDGRSLSCFLRDPDGRLQAGLDGFTWGGYAKVEYLWVGRAEGTPRGWGQVYFARPLTPSSGGDVGVSDQR